MEQKDRNYRRYIDGDSENNWELTEKIFAQDTSINAPPMYTARRPVRVAVQLAKISEAG